MKEFERIGIQNVTEEELGYGLLPVKEPLERKM
jgi:hypothetical protein